MDSPRACRALKQNGRPCRAPPCARAAPASGTRPSRPRRPPKRGGWAACAAGAKGRSGAPTPWRGSARARICGASWSWRWRTRWSWRTPSLARGRSRIWCPWRPGSRRPASGRRACGRWRTACGGRLPMRDRERRLRRVTTRMTVRQRVAALLAAEPGNTAVYDDIGRGLTPAGWAAFRRYGRAARSAQRDHPRRPGPSRVRDH